MREVVEVDFLKGRPAPPRPKGSATGINSPAALAILKDMKHLLGRTLVLQSELNEESRVSVAGPHGVVRGEC